MVADAEVDPVSKSPRPPAKSRAWNGYADHAGGAGDPAGARSPPSHRGSGRCALGSSEDDHLPPLREPGRDSRRSAGLAAVTPCVPDGLCVYDRMKWTLEQVRRALASDMGLGSVGAALTDEDPDFTESFREIINARSDVVAGVFAPLSTPARSAPTSTSTPQCPCSSVRTWVRISVTARSANRGQTASSTRCARTRTRGPGALRPRADSRIARRVET